MCEANSGILTCTCWENRDFEPVFFGERKHFHVLDNGKMMQILVDCVVCFFLARMNFISLNLAAWIMLFLPQKPIFFRERLEFNSGGNS